LNGNQGLHTFTCGALQPPNLKLQKRFLHRDKDLISADFVPKVSPQLWIDLPRITPTHVTMLTMTYKLSSTIEEKAIA